MKFSTGDYVVHPGQGVCLVSGIDERRAIVGASAEDPGHEELRLEYELTPKTGAKVSIHYPVSQEENLRPIIDGGTAMALIVEAPTLESDGFEKQQSWTVREHFMGMLRTGDCREAMRVVKTLRERMNLAQSQGRKPKSCYTNVFQEARQRLLDELSLALDMSDDEVESLIGKSFAKHAAISR